jgi:hypothetical protein
MNIVPSPLMESSMKTNPYRKCIRLDGLQVETSTLSYKVFRLFGDVSKSVSPDDMVTLF